jgi:coproporphyrinogen III oxidase-like Fe-S oxidoreductase
VAADLLNEEELSLIEKMRPGLIQLEIGVQSTNEKTIREIRRTMKFDEVARIVNRINAGHNVHQHLDLIAGLPYEDLESFKKSFNDVYHLYPEQLQLGFLKVLKGSYMDENKESYGLIHKSKPPYEVLGTRWLSYEDLLELKMVEQMVEIYYNSGQFAYTLRHLERHFESPYELYYSLGKYYEEEGLHMMSHSRITRYEILLDFIRTFVKEEEDLYLELLTFDLYLREHVKNRPTFAGEYTVSKEMKREYPKSVHLERFSYDVMGECEKKEQIILFDYEKRSKLTHQASCKILQNSLQ